jgi:hypothetical protein
MTSITYEKYNEHSFVVRGDKCKYSEEMKRIGGRWNTRLKGGDGWTVPLGNESLLKNIIEKEAPKKQSHGDGEGRGRGRGRGRGKICENTKNNVENEEDDREEISPNVQKQSEDMLKLLETVYKNKAKKISSPQDTPPRQMIREKHSPPRERKNYNSESDSDSDGDVDRRKKHRQHQHQHQHQQTHPTDNFHGSNEFRRSCDYTPPKKSLKELSREYRREESSHGREDSLRDREQQSRRNISPERRGYVPERRPTSPIRHKLFDEPQKRNKEKNTQVESRKKSDDALTCYTDFGKKPIDFRRIQATMDNTNSDSDSETESSSDDESSSSSSSSTSPLRNFSRQEPERRFLRR